MRKLSHYIVLAVLFCVIGESRSGVSYSPNQCQYKSCISNENYGNRCGLAGAQLRAMTTPQENEESSLKRKRLPQEVRTVAEKTVRTPDEVQNPDTNTGNEESNDTPKRGEFVSKTPKYSLEDPFSYQQAIKNLQEILKGVSANGKLPDEYKMKNARWKRKNDAAAQSSQSEKAQPVQYLDYTNSMMPFNEGTRKRARGTNKWNVKLDSEISKEDPNSKYSRVRRYLDQERIVKRIKGSTTLEAKEAAMSRVLDPNLNLDGILEPHVRERRRRSVSKNAFKYRFKP